MWELFDSYRDQVKDNPRVVSEFHGREGEERFKPLERPLTLSGFNVYVWNYEGVESKGVLQYFKNQDKLYDNYMPICSRIKEVIRTDQIEGGMVGQYNASITQRLNGLKEQTESVVKVEQALFGEDE
jgi:hypothetical protein